MINQSKHYDVLNILCTIENHKYHYNLPKRRYKVWQFALEHPVFLLLWLFFYLFVYSKYTLWKFQNGKVGLYRPKIDQDTRNIVKIRKLRNNSFCSKNIIFEEKLSFFIGFLQDSLYLGQFLTNIGPLYHFGIVKVCTLGIQIG